MKYLSVEELPQYSTISVNEAAHVCGISRSTAYSAVAEGQFFETIRVKNRLLVLAQPLYRKLMGSAINEVDKESCSNPTDGGVE